MALTTSLSMLSTIHMVLLPSVHKGAHSIVVVRSSNLSCTTLIVLHKNSLHCCIVGSLLNTKWVIWRCNLFLSSPGQVTLCVEINVYFNTLNTHLCHKGCLKIPYRPARQRIEKNIWISICDHLYLLHTYTPVKKRNSSLVTIVIAGRSYSCVEIWNIQFVYWTLLFHLTSHLSKSNKNIKAERCESPLNRKLHFCVYVLFCFLFIVLYCFFPMLLLQHNTLKDCLFWFGGFAPFGLDIEPISRLILRNEISNARARSDKQLTYILDFLHNCNNHGYCIWVS